MSLSALRRATKYSPFGRLLVLPVRTLIILRELYALASKGGAWLLSSREWANFTYDYTKLGVENAIAVTSLLTRYPPEEIEKFAEELRKDSTVQELYRNQRLSTDLHYISDAKLRIGRQFFHYLVVRSARPRLVVEAGTDKGLGALLIALALRRNATEGYPGRVVTVDCQADRGQLVPESLRDLVTFAVGDSVAYIRSITEPIDYFIHETMNEPKHCASQFEAVEGRLAGKAIVTSAWFNQPFVEFCRRNKLVYFTFAEEPADHWYRGGRVGVAVRRQDESSGNS